MLSEFNANTIEANSPAKKLNLIYLANDVAQQSRARRKEDYIRAFSAVGFIDFICLILIKVMVDAFQAALIGSPPETREKIKRVLDVWKQRQIFEPHLLKQLSNMMEKSCSGVPTKILSSASNFSSLNPELVCLLYFFNSNLII